MVTHQLTVEYPGAFLPAFSCHKFEVYLGESQIVPRQKYRPKYVGCVHVAPGNHRLEVRAINEFTGRRKSSFFNFEMPDEDRGGRSIGANPQ